MRFWPFFTKKEPDPTLVDLYQRIRMLEGDMKALEREWRSEQDSNRRMLAKIVKRAKAVDRDAEETAQDAPESTNGTGVRVDPREIFRLNQLAKRR